MDPKYHRIPLVKQAFATGDAKDVKSVKMNKNNELL